VLPTSTKDVKNVVDRLRKPPCMIQFQKCCKQVVHITTRRS